jgi:hypothetical protein
MNAIAINKSEVTRLLGDEPGIASRVLEFLTSHRMKNQAERQEIECLVFQQVITKIERMEKLPAGYLLQRHPNGKINQEPERVIYRYLAMIVVVKKFKFKQSHLMEGLKMHHSTYNHAKQVVNDLWFCNPRWQQVIRKLEEKFEIEIHA